MSDPFSLDEILNQAKSLRSNQSSYSFHINTEASHKTAESVPTQVPTPAAAQKPAAPRTSAAEDEVPLFVPKKAAPAPAKPVFAGMGAAPNAVPTPAPAAPQPVGKREIRDPNRLTPEEVLGQRAAPAQAVFDKENPNAFLEKIKKENPVVKPEVPQSEPLTYGDTIFATPAKKFPRPAAEGDTLHAGALPNDAQTDFFVGFADRQDQQEEEPALPGQQTLAGFAAQAPDREGALRKDLAESRRKKVQQFVLSGTEQEETGAVTPPTVYADAEPEEYETYADAKRIRADLVTRLRSQRKSMWLTLLLTVLMTLLAVLAPMDRLPDALSPDGNPGAYLAVTAILFVCAVLLNATAVLGGLKSLFLLRPDIDSPLGLCGLLTLAQLVLFPIFPETFEAQSVQLLCGAFGAALVLGGWGKCALLRRILKNFRCIANKREKTFLSTIPNENDAISLTKGMFAGAPVITYDRRAIDLKSYLRYAYAGTPADGVPEKSLWFLIPAAAAVAIVSAFFGKGTPDAVYMVTAAAWMLLLCCPFMTVLIANAPLKRTARALDRHHAMLAGYEAADRFADTDLIAIDAAELFPKGTVQLCNVKMFGTRPIDDTLLAAAGVMLAAGGPLAPVFESVISGKREMLPKVDTLVYEERMGISGWVNGDRVLIGNRTLLQNHGIPVPEESVERAMLGQDQKIVYLAAQGQLAAAFLLRYYAEERAAIRLRHAVRRGAGLLVSGCDQNVTPELIAETYELPIDCIRVLDAAGRRVLRPYTEASSSGDALLMHGGTFYSYLMCLLACRRLRTAGRTAAVVQTVCVVLGALLAAASIWFGFGTTVLSAILWQLVSTVACLLIPSVVRPD